MTEIWLYAGSMRFSQILVVNALLLLSSTVAAQQQSFQNLTVNGDAEVFAVPAHKL